MIERTIPVPVDAAARIVERPDGFSWVDSRSGIKVGPFPTAAEARADMNSCSESDFALNKTVEDVGEAAEISVRHTED